MARERCLRCARARCLCHLALQPPRAHQTEIWLLQHPFEQYEAKGTARLLALSLANCRLIVGEEFERPPNPEGRVEALLYPGETAPLPSGTTPARLRLYVLDGSWRKSRLILHRNAWLQALPRVALGTLPPSGYAIRKAQGEHQRSTLEATALALDQLESGKHYEALMPVLVGLQEELGAFRRLG